MLHPTHALRGLLAATVLLASAYARAADITITLTAGASTDTVIQGTISGSKVVTSDNGNADWDSAGPETEEWRLVNRDTGNNIFAAGAPGGNLAIVEDMIVTGSATASNGAVSVTMNRFDLVTRFSDNRNDFGFSFNGNPNPAFAVNDTITFSGTFSIALPAGFTAAHLQFGSWTADSEAFSWPLQFGTLSATLVIAPPPAETVLFTEGADVPGVPGKKFTGFGVPAINANSHIAYLGKWSGGAGIFVDGALVVATDQVISGTAAVKSLKDPVIDDAGRIALPCVLTGAGITSANDAAILSEAPGGILAIVAQEGAEPAGVAGAKWKAFQSVAAPGGGRGVIILGTMLAGTGGITTANDTGVWSADATGALHLVLQEGTTVIGGKTVKNFKVLKAVSGSPGQTRAFNANGELVAQVTFADGAQSVVHIALP